MTISNRESWLQAAAERMAPWFKEINAMEIPPLRVSCAWAKRASRNSIGWCWHRDVSADGTNEIQISPEKDNPVTVLHVLLHEMIHASDNGESQHRGYFRTTALALGFEGKMTATVPGAALHARLEALAEELGPYPHAAINPMSSRIGKQGTRMLKLICPVDGYALRTTRKWIELGFPSCPCGTEMELA